MKPGLEFENSGMELICIAFHGTERTNVGLFLRLTDGMYITARDISQDPDGTYSWVWGHYHENINEACLDISTRINV
jgi:hypothetical protein